MRNKEPFFLALLGDNFGHAISRKLLGRSQLFFHRLFDVILILYVIVDDVTFGTLSLILNFFYDSFCGELISETIEEKIKEKMG